MRSVLTIVAVLFLSAPHVISEPFHPDSVKYHFNPVVVTATKAEGAQRDLAASVSVIDEQTIEMAATSSVLELVKDRVPGVYLTERSVMGYGVAAGAAGALSIRGVGGNPVTGVLVLRNGRPDIMGMMGHAIPDAYSLSSVERIEIVRGPESFLYGTNAMGGVINIVSKERTKNGFETRVSGSLGSYASQKASLQHGGKTGNFDYYVTASARRTDGHRDYSDYNGDSYSSHLGYQIGSSTKLELNAHYSDIYLLDPGPASDPFTDHWYDLVRSGADLTVSHSSGVGNSYLKLHGNFGKHKIYDGWRSTDRTIGAMFYHNAQLIDGNKTTAGFDVKQYGGEAEESLNKVPVINYDEKFINEWAPYIHTQQLFFQRFIASAGIRIEQHELYGSEVLPMFGVVSHLSPATSVRLSAAKGFRSPAIRELFVFPPRNRDLKPEKMWNYELGVTQSIGEQAEVEAVAFRSDGTDMIRMQGQFPNVSWVNSGEFTHTGYELLFHYRPLERLILSANWTDMDLGDETRQTPEQKLGVHLSYQFNRVRLAAGLLHVSELYGADNRQQKLPDYSLVDLTASVRIWREMHLNLHLKNVLDEEYFTMSGYPMPGRMLMTDLSYSF